MHASARARVWGALAAHPGGGHLDAGERAAIEALIDATDWTDDEVVAALSRDSVPVKASAVGFVRAVCSEQIPQLRRRAAERQVGRRPTYPVPKIASSGDAADEPTVELGDEYAQDEPDWEFLDLWLAAEGRRHANDPRGRR